ncbi:hypothetical protein [Kitasatospora indigofera]|uniref:hypothetical protein n=1 Tax=Kitasatospora indigofera TaxID=67307 RepID=UPI0036B84F25
MSDTIGSPLGGNALSDLGLTSRPPTPVETVREAYSFACLSCGYGWEQAYEIEHHVARDGHIVFEYHANGVRVPSPLLKPTCPGCGGHTVRIMRAGRVAGTERSFHHAPGYGAHAEPAGPARPPMKEGPRGRLAGFWAWLRG